MAGFNDIQRAAAQSIQATVADVESSVYTQETETQGRKQAAPLGADNAVLTGGGPSYMQAIEALMFSQIALYMNGTSNALGNLHALSNGGNTKSAKDSEKSLATNYGKGNNFGVFNPMNYPQPGVNPRGGNGGYSGGGYGSGGRTGAGNVATGGIDRMIELMLAQTLGQAGSVNNQRLKNDAVTLIGRSSDTETNPFRELTGGLVKLLAEQINAAGENAPLPSAQLRSLLTQLSEQQPTEVSSETLSLPQLHALMDELSVMQLIQGTRTNSESAPNPMVNNIMALMQNLLGAQNGGTVSASQMQNLLAALMSNLKSDSAGGDSPAAAMMQQMLPEMMAMLTAETAATPGAVAPQQTGSGGTPVRLAPFRASIQSNGTFTGSSGGTSAPSKSALQPSKNGSVMILDGSQDSEIAGGFGIGASLGKNEQGAEQIQVGTFSWNGGQDAVALNAKGDAGVTSDGGRTWNPLPTQGVSTYNPGNGGPSISYNPISKTVTFSASGNNSNDNVSAEMCADSHGVSFTNIEGTGVTANGELASALS